MASSAPSTNTRRTFLFIVSDAPGPSKDPVLRKSIRKQAMVDAGRARRLRGNHRRINLGQPVICNDRTGYGSPQISDPESESKASSTDQEDKSPEDALLYHSDQEAQISACDLHKTLSNRLIIHRFPETAPSYHRVRCKFRIDLPQLSMLTSFNMSSSIINGGSSDPKRLASLMEYQRYSFLEFVPRMYDSNRLMAAATDSLLARVSGILLPTPSNPELEIVLYMRALKLLQAAVEDRTNHFDADMLCAIQLLSLRDLLEPSRSDAWAAHVRGCARLFQMWTPRRIESEFEKALFIAHVGPIISEAFKAHTPCYLERPEWKHLYMSLINETDCLTPQSPVAMKARSSIFSFPRLLRDIDNAIRGEDLFDIDKLHALEDRCQMLHRDLLECREEHRVYCLLTSSSMPSMPELCLQRELFGAVMDCLALVKRLLATVSETYNETLEDEVQRLAHWMLNAQRYPSPKWSWLFGGHETRVAQAAIRTRHLFAKDISGELPERRRLYMRRCYLTWVHLLQSDS